MRSKGAASNNRSRWKSGLDCMDKVNLVRRLVRRARQMSATRSNAVMLGNIYENRLTEKSVLAQKFLSSGRARA